MDYIARPCVKKRERSLQIFILKNFDFNRTSKQVHLQTKSFHLVVFVLCEVGYSPSTGD